MLLGLSNQQTTAMMTSANPHEPLFEMTIPPKTASLRARVCVCAGGGMGVGGGERVRVCASRVVGIFFFL